MYDSDIKLGTIDQQNKPINKLLQVSFTDFQQGCFNNSMGKNNLR